MKTVQTFAALKHPNYRLWFGGQLISLFGTWMQITAQSFLVFELTHSPAYLGYVSFSFGLPSWFFMLYGGVIADRVPRRTLLIITQCSMMMLALVLATVTFTGIVQPWHIVVFVLGLGLANAFDAPARQAFVIELVDREDITNAVALNSTLFNMSSVVGPAVAGVVYMLLGPAWCFTLNGLSFIAAITALLLMKVKPTHTPHQKTSALSSLKEGVRYVVRDPLIRTLMCLVAVTAMFGFAYITLIPAWAVTILGGDATTNGLLHSARGAGAVLSALLIASLGRFTFKGKLLTSSTFLLPILLIVFALIRSLPLSLLIMFCMGVAQLLIMNLANVLVQTFVSDNLRGRVMSIYSLTHFGLMPIGGLFAGTLAEYAGEPATVIICGLVCFASSVILWIYAPMLRRVK
ncbi:MAG: MFS transporter [Thermodesulfobacteriota bacterium]